MCVVLDCYSLDHQDSSTCRQFLLTGWSRLTLLQKIVIPYWWGILRIPGHSLYNTWRVCWNFHIPLKVNLIYQGLVKLNTFSFLQYKTCIKSAYWTHLLSRMTSHIFTVQLKLYSKQYTLIHWLWVEWLLYLSRTRQEFFVVFFNSDPTCVGWFVLVLTDDIGLMLDQRCATNFNSKQSVQA